MNGIDVYLIAVVHLHANTSRGRFVRNCTHLTQIYMVWGSAHTSCISPMKLKCKF